MHFDLPENCFVNKIIPKKKFLEKIKDKNIKREFELINRIKWLYNLSPKTVGIEATDKVEEIQLFGIYLKTKTMPTKSLVKISKLIPYPVLFIIEYLDETIYAIYSDEFKKLFVRKEGLNNKLNFSGINLEEVYQNLIIQLTGVKTKNYREAMEIYNTIEQTEKEIKALQNKIKKEKQFKYKVELNRELLKKQEFVKELKEKYIDF